MLCYDSSVHYCFPFCQTIVAILRIGITTALYVSAELYKCKTNLCQATYQKKNASNSFSVALKLIITSRCTPLVVSVLPA